MNRQTEGRHRDTEAEKINKQIERKETESE